MFVVRCFFTHDLFPFAAVYVGFGVLGFGATALVALVLICCPGCCWPRRAKRQSRSSDRGAGSMARLVFCHGHLLPVAAEHGRYLIHPIPPCWDCKLASGRWECPRRPEQPHTGKRKPPPRRGIREFLRNSWIWRRKPNFFHPPGNLFLLSDYKDHLPNQIWNFVIFQLTMRVARHCW